MHPSVSNRPVPYVVTADFNAAGASVGTGAVEVYTVPAYTLVLDARIEVLTADDAGNSGTLALGDGATANRYQTAAAPTTLGFMTATGTKFAYKASDTVDVTVGTGAVNAVARVVLTLVDVADYS